jgi:hypothetical protein
MKAAPATSSPFRVPVVQLKPNRSIKLPELKTRKERRHRAKLEAVIHEFGGRKPERLLVPHDDPMRDALVVRLAEELLFLRDQVRRVGKARRIPPSRTCCRPAPS